MSSSSPGSGVWGSMTSFLNPTGRARALDRLKSGLPDVDSKRHREILHQSFASRSLQQACLFDLKQLNPTETCRRLSISGWENVNALRESDRGIVFATAPLGCWELTLQPLVFGGSRGRLGIYPISSLTPGSTQKYHLEAIDEDHLTTKIERSLESGIDILLVVDPLGTASTFTETPFLGQTARLDKTLITLMDQRQAPVVPIFGWATDRSSNHVSVRQPVLVGHNSDASGVDQAQGFLLKLESEIRANPELWPWMSWPR